MSWAQLGRDVLQQIDQPHADLKKIAAETILKIRENEPNSDIWQSRLSIINREILKKYPRSNAEKNNYFYDPSGKANLEKWRHNIFQHLNMKPDNPICQKLEAKGDTTGKDDAATSSTSKPTLTLEKMINQLDPELKEMAQATMNAQGIDWQVLIEKSLNQYCKSYVNRTQSNDINITEIETETLLNDSTYRTHPERAKELTKRAILAIKRHNDNQPENKMRWMISASIVGQLIKSKTTTVNQYLQDFKGDIESHNAKFEFSSMHNRGKGDIREAVDLIKLCPTGE